MITDRPLKEVPTRALYALHMGIEKRKRLIVGAYQNKLNGVIETCSMGSMVEVDGISKHDHYNAVFKACENLGIVNHSDSNENSHKIWGNIYGINDCFDGTPEERREFMLRHIVNELRQRGKSLPKEHEKSTKILTNESP